MRNKKTETRLLQGPGLSFKAYKTYITAVFTHLNGTKANMSDVHSNLHFNATADVADKGKLYKICSTPELSERNFTMVLK